MFLGKNTLKQWKEKTQLYQKENYCQRILEKICNRSWKEHQLIEELVEFNEGERVSTEIIIE